MSGALINNPIAWAHFKVRGGLRSHLWSTAGFILLISAAVTVTGRLHPSPGLFSAWTTGMLGMEMVILVFFGCASIGTAIRRDITVGLLESHRLMPISPGAAIMGYLTGPTLQALNLVAASFLIGTATATLGGVPMERWLMGNFTVVVFAAFLWITIAFSSFLFKNAFTTLIAVIAPAVSSGGSVIQMVPGLRILMAPVLGMSIFTLVGRTPRVENTYVYSFIA
jgi:hypothetical protein